MNPLTAAAVRSIGTSPHHPFLARLQIEALHVLAARQLSQ
jgi:hypothetical protein